MNEDHKFDLEAPSGSRLDETGHIYGNLSREETSLALDELFRNALQQKGARVFEDMFRFLRNCRQYSVFNMGLAYLQRPGCAAVATKKQWGELGRTIKSDAIPIIILRPFGPVMPVFEIADTDGPPLRGEADSDWIVTRGNIPEAVLMKLLGKALTKDGINIRFVALGYFLGGDARPAHIGPSARTYWAASDHEDQTVHYRVRIAESLDRTARFAVLAHELAHIYCGHLGANGNNHWPDRRRALSHGQRELEAEAVAHIVLSRRGLGKNSDAYLAAHIEEGDLEKISVTAILDAANRIEMHART